MIAVRGFMDAAVTPTFRGMVVILSGTPLPNRGSPQKA